MTLNKNKNKNKNKINTVDRTKLGVYTYIIAGPHNKITFIISL